MTGLRTNLWSNPWSCGDRIMVYVDVSNLECPVLQIVMVGGARIVMLAVFVSSNGLPARHLRLLSFHCVIGSESDIDLTAISCRSFVLLSVGTVVWRGGR